MMSSKEHLLIGACGLVGSRVLSAHVQNVNAKTVVVQKYKKQNV